MARSARSALLLPFGLALACGQIETGSPGGAGGAADDGRACEGAEPPAGYETCRSSSDCTDPLVCAQRPFAPPGCGPCGVNGDCFEDEECGLGNVCVLEPDPCGCGSIGSCAPGCTEGSCIDGDLCDDTGHCQPLSCDSGYTCPVHQVCNDRSPDEHGCSPARCDEGHVCPEGSVCEPDAIGDAHGCRPLRCTEGAPCPDNTRCDPESLLETQCQRLSCTADAECDCGYCISGLCQDRLSVCVQAPIG